MQCHIHPFLEHLCHLLRQPASIPHRSSWEEISPKFSDTELLQLTPFSSPSCQCKDKPYSWSNLTQPHAAEPPGDLICPPPWSAGYTLNQQMSSQSIHVFEDAFQNRECVNPLIWKPGLLKNLLLWQFRRSCCRWDRWNVLINFLPSYVWILSFLYAESVHSSLLVFWGPEQCASAVKEVPW